jgi:prolyl-tRNA synthetase
VDPLTQELLRSEGLSLDLSTLPLGYLGPDLDDALLGDQELVVDLSEAKAGIAGVATLDQPKPLLQRSFLRLFDPTAIALEAFVCGANRVDGHRVGASWSGLGLQPTAAAVVDLRNAQAGDRCLHDPDQRLEANRGIEVGHIFQLGRKYSTAMDACFTGESGERQPFWMGCYGIGVSRLAQAAVEQHHDANGIRWPLAIAPFEVVVVPANVGDEQQASLAEQLYGELQNAGVDVLLDDRTERAGVKFKDGDLLGIPWRVVVGRAAAEGLVELVDRQGTEPETVAAEALLGLLLPRIEQQRRGLA